MRITCEDDISHHLLNALFTFQISVVGDFSEEDIESCILDYLGTVRATRDSEIGQQSSPIMFRSYPSDLQFQQVRNKSNSELIDVSEVRNLWNILEVV